MRTSHILSMIGAVGVLALACAPSAQPEPSKAPAPSCFFSRDWQGWKATDDGKAIYIRVGLHQIYRLDLASSCPDLHYPNAHLVTRLRGDSICDALDIDLKVSDGSGFAVPCIVSKLSQLSQAEAEALPKALRP